MKLHVIHDGVTLRVWSLAEGSYTLGQGPSATLRLAHPLCPDVLCRIDVDRLRTGSAGARRERARFTVTEDGARLAGPDGQTFRSVIQNGGALTVGPFILQAHEPPEAAPFFESRSSAPTAVAKEPERSGAAPEGPLVLLVQYEKGGRPLELRDGMLLGSDPRIDDRLGLRVDNRSVSREHARIEKQQGAFWLTDLGSTNGTWLDRVRLDPHVPQRLVAGMTIRLSPNPKVPAIEVHPVAELVGRQPRDGAAMAGESAAMSKLRAAAAQLAKGRAPIRIFGERGTGKGLLARFIAFHARQKLVRFDCTTLSLTLAEAELFGHDKGAFTDAKEEKAGMVDDANGGILFFDEIGDLAFDLQKKVLGLLEEHVYRRVGGTKILRASFRPVFATLHDLGALVASRAFRPDLENRTQGHDLTIPPLRERMEDIAPIVQHFLATRPGEKHGIAPAALAALQRYDWPGNVRELTHLLDAAADRAGPGEEISEAAVREWLAQRVEKRQAADDLELVPNVPEHLIELEKAYMREGLRRANGMWMRAAKQMGYKSPATFRRRALAWGLIPKGQNDDEDEG